MGNLNAMFASTPRSTVRDHLYLVCRVYRMGVLNPDAKAKKQLSEGARAIADVQDNQVVFRRPFGVGVIDLAMIDLHQYQHGEEKEQTMMLFKTPGSEGYGFPDLHVVLMKSGGRAVDGAAEPIYIALASWLDWECSMGLWKREARTSKPFDAETRKTAGQCLSYCGLQTKKWSSSATTSL